MTKEELSDYPIYHLSLGESMTFENSFSSGTGYEFQDNPYPQGLEVTSEIIPPEKCCGFPMIKRWTVTGVKPGDYLFSSEFLRPWDLSTATRFGAYIHVSDE